jgi:hypothetical protein
VSFAGGVAVTKFFHALYIGKDSINFRDRHAYTGSGFSPAAGQKKAGQIEKETNERRTLNVQHRIMNSVNFIKRTEQHPEQAPALQERSFPSKFDSAAFDVLKP